MEYTELTEKIIGCAYRVYNKMGFGFIESLILNFGERKVEIKRKVSDSSDSPRRKGFRIRDKQDFKKISCLSCNPV